MQQDSMSKLIVVLKEGPSDGKHMTLPDWAHEIRVPVVEEEDLRACDVSEPSQNEAVRYEQRFYRPVRDRKDESGYLRDLYDYENGQPYVFRYVWEFEVDWAVRHDYMDFWRWHRHPTGSDPRSGGGYVAQWCGYSFFYDGQHFGSAKQANDWCEWMNAKDITERHPRCLGWPKSHREVMSMLRDEKLKWMQINGKA